MLDDSTRLIASLSHMFRFAVSQVKDSRAVSALAFCVLLGLTLTCDKLGPVQSLSALVSSTIAWFMHFICWSITCAFRRGKYGSDTRSDHFHWAGSSAEVRIAGAILLSYLCGAAESNDSNNVWSRVLIH